MVNYRRNRVAGGTYFFTSTLRDRRSRRLTDYIEELRGSYMRVSRARPFETIAIVVLPEHLHAVWRLPERDSDYSGRWREIKANFAHALTRSGRAHHLDGMAQIDLCKGAIGNIRSAMKKTYGATSTISTSIR